MPPTDASQGPAERTAAQDSPARDPASPVVLFDGVCNLCDSTVRFVLERDRRGELRFGALGTDAAERVLRAAGVPKAEIQQRSDSLDTVLLVDADGVHDRSEAALRIARHLRAPWCWAAVLRVIPRSIRDGLYRLVARHRYRWFGTRESCRLPRPDEAERFI